MHEAPTSVSALQTLKTRFGCLVLIFVRRIHWLRIKVLTSSEFVFDFEECFQGHVDDDLVFLRLQKRPIL